MYFFFDTNSKVHTFSFNVYRVIPKAIFNFKFELPI